MAEVARLILRLGQTARSRTLACLAVVAFSAILRCYGLSHSSYWYDELVSVSFARSPSWGSIFWDNAPPLYHLILKIWVAVLGSSEIATRLLSVVFSVLATATLIRIGRELSDFYGGLLVGLCHALSQLSVLYAQETRMYAVFELAVALQFLQFLRLVLGLPGASTRKLFLTTGFLALTHYLAIIPLAIEGLTVLTMKSRARRSPWTLAAGGLGALILAASYIHFFKWDPLGWQVLKFDTESFAGTVKVVLKSFTNESWISFALITIALTVDTVTRARNDGGRRLLLALTVIAPFPIMAVAAYAFHRLVFLPRYFIFIVPPLACWLGLALRELTTRSVPRLGRTLTAMLALLPLAVQAATLPQAYVPRKEDWRRAAEIVEESGTNLVLTCNKNHVRGPYFDERRIEVRQWNPTEASSHDLARTEVLRRQRIWIVDTLPNTAYYDSVRKWAEELGFQVTELRLDSGGYASLKMMSIVDPNP